jgi:RimJ/RimL family protein N-acetyltransferase
VSQQTIQTHRLVIRPFRPDDLPVIHRILDQTFGDGSKVEEPAALLERRSWLQWSILNQEWLPKLHQPPYGDQAITLKSNGELIGSAGYVPLLDVYEQIPELRVSTSASRYAIPEVGLFWVIDPGHQKQGYATEAAQALIEYGFKQLRLKRIIATTEYENIASQGVMRKVGMKITRNPLPEPPWLQVVGVLENKDDPSEVRYKGIHCSLTIERPLPGIVVVRISGHDVGEFGDAPFQELAKDLASHSPIELFIDTRDAGGASLDVSNDWALWLGTHRSHFRHVSMLTGSRFIQLTADFVRRFAELGEIMRIYTDPTAFDGALAGSVARAKAHS